MAAKSKKEVRVVEPVCEFCKKPFGQGERRVTISPDGRYGSHAHELCEALDSLSKAQTQGRKLAGEVAALRTACYIIAGNTRTTREMASETLATVTRHVFEARNEEHMRTVACLLVVSNGAAKEAGEKAFTNAAEDNFLKGLAPVKGTLRGTYA